MFVFLCTCVSVMLTNRIGAKKLYVYGGLACIPGLLMLIVTTSDLLNFPGEKYLNVIGSMLIILGFQVRKLFTKINLKLFLLILIIQFLIYLLFMEFFIHTVIRKINNIFKFALFMTYYVFYLLTVIVYNFYSEQFRCVFFY